MHRQIHPSPIRRIGGWLVIASVGLCGHASGSSTIQDFDNPGSPFTLTNFGGPAASVVAPGNPGNALQLTFAGTGGTSNSIGFDRTQVGAFQTLTADFDFKLNGTADGLSFALLNTATFGTTGAMPQPASGFEEPNYAGSLGVEFDTFNNGGEDTNANHIGLHFNNAEVAVDTNPGFTLGAGAWHHVHLLVNPVAGGSDVTLILDNGASTAFSNVFVAGLDPYEGRVGFGARTGGATEDALVDNINVDYGVSAGGGAPLPKGLLAGSVALLAAWRVRRLMAKTTSTA
jgi:hypothetical protein